MLRNFLFLFSFLFVVELSAQNCTGDYTWLQNGTTISFYGVTSPNVTNVYYSFGDGNFDYSNNLNPVHTYAGAGTYNACIHFTDSTINCTDSTCYTILIDTCYATLNYTQNGNTISFTGYANGGSANTVYQWNFGDSQTSTQQNPVHTYSNIGIYTVCFSYYDLTTGCSDSICTQIQFGVCNADFSMIDSMGYVFFVNSSTLANAGVYYWDFGDGNYSTQYNPSHVYANVGTYLVCLTAYDSMQNFCDSTCHYVTINNLIGVNEKSNVISNLNLMPNPSDENSTLSFYLNTSATVTFNVYDSYGRMIKEISKNYSSSGKQNLVIDTNDFSSGVYFIKSNANGQFTNTKMIVSH